jgi:hypothetical protein
VLYFAPLKKTDMSKYSLSAEFTAQPEKTPLLRFPDGETDFRIISEDFVQCKSLFVKTADGKGYSKIWEHTDEVPDLPAGHTFEQGRNPKRVVLFKAVTRDEPTVGKILVASIKQTEDILDEANLRDGLTVSWMTCKRSGKGMQTTYKIRSQEPTAFAKEWPELEEGLDFSEAMA